MIMKKIEGEVNLCGTLVTVAFGDGVLTLSGVKVEHVQALIAHVEKFKVKGAHIQKPLKPGKTQPLRSSAPAAPPPPNGTNGHAKAAAEVKAATTPVPKFTPLPPEKKATAPAKAALKEAVEEVEDDEDEQPLVAAEKNPSDDEPFVDDYPATKLADEGAALASAGKAPPIALAKATGLKAIVGWFEERGVSGEQDLVAVCSAWRPVVPFLARLTPEVMEQRVRSMVRLPVDKDKD